MLSHEAPWSMNAYFCIFLRNCEDILDSCQQRESVQCYVSFNIWWYSSFNFSHSGRCLVLVSSLELSCVFICLVASDGEAFCMVLMSYMSPFQCILFPFNLFCTTSLKEFKNYVCILEANPLYSVCVCVCVWCLTSLCSLLTHF